MAFHDYTSILKGKKIVKVPTWNGQHGFRIPKNRQVGSTLFSGGRVSTVFLGMEPIYFETMVFGGILDQWQWRYMTYSEALTGHRRVVKMVRSLNRLHTLKHSTK